MSQNIADLSDLPPPDPDGLAVFCDVDGTLVDIADTPEGVHVSDALRATLDLARDRLSGAFALVTGRGLADVERMFEPSRYATAAVHGLEIRTRPGEPAESYRPDAAFRAEIDRLVERFSDREGIIIEDKAYSIALHFRLAPEAEGDILIELHRSRKKLGSAFQVLGGKKLAELKPLAANKGSALRHFMADPPFAGRRPIYFGDDTTDEYAFEAANELGGVSVRIGAHPDTRAQMVVGDRQILYTWLKVLSGGSSG